MSISQSLTRSVVPPPIRSPQRQNSNDAFERNTQDILRMTHSAPSGLMVESFTGSPPMFIRNPLSPISSVRFGDEYMGPKEGMVDAEIQTVYRESETQTLPWAPKYVIAPGSSAKPELVTLGELGIELGPDGKLDRESYIRIERARQRRRFEASLPPLKDQASLEIRQKMMEEQEKLEFSWKEQELKKRGMGQLETFKMNVAVEEMERELHSHAIAESIVNRSAQNRDQQLNLISNKRVQATRKKIKDRDNVEGKRAKRDIISDFANYNSEIYAPLTREGRRKEVLILEDIRPPTLKTTDGIASLETDVLMKTAHHVTDPLVTKQHKNNPTASQRREAQIAEHLDKLNTTLKGENKEDSNALPSVVERIEKPPPRPPTPTIDAPKEDETKIASLILLQSILRGRAIQNMMFEGRDRRRELIEELKSDDAFVDIEESRAPKKESSHQQLLYVPGMQDPLPSDEEYKAKVVESIFDSIIGNIVGDGLDFLSKELVRMRQMKELERMVAQAEEVRRLKEIRESERRREEQRQREIQDEVFTQVQRVHQKTARTFIEQAMDRAVDAIRKREEEAETERRRLEEERVAAADVSDEQVINDVIFSLLFPTVEERFNKQREDLYNQKYERGCKLALQDALAGKLG
ncbi:hypothetical protein PROFUN_06225 [Planoprotostelium fungivorum]|uniref:Cilia- and flagella-associated protein 91 n=1 Tax=Planoprotostelium fungivorum TaxID=1890364 RepID=A0A2P6MZ13_9EUKA|nr:hypothetical protein PROFUN_06225 [Planoprotostelium fungivorum]